MDSSKLSALLLIFMLTISSSPLSLACGYCPPSTPKTPKASSTHPSSPSLPSSSTHPSSPSLPSSSTHPSSPCLPSSVNHPSQCHQSSVAGSHLGPEPPAAHRHQHQRRNAPSTPSSSAPAWKSSARQCTSATRPSPAARSWKASRGWKRHCVCAPPSKACLWAWTSCSPWLSNCL
ncbi:hypothetical protein BHE74_00015387 [Ensete ventricosum]|nr:hypothetical protein BHE74_00015387 [Ensete ventricosum]RZS13500.1 hypothetical protein BHM03_00045097 [Ensete ventricosum]